MSKYYEKDLFHAINIQKEFETKLYKKTRAASNTANSNSRSNEAEIALVDGLTVVYRPVNDVTLYVIGDTEENELLMITILDTLFDSLSSLLKGIIEKRTLLHHLELLLLSIDELIDGGIPFELDSHNIENRVLLRGAVPESISSYQEMTIGQLADKGRAALAKQFIK